MRGSQKDVITFIINLGFDFGLAQIVYVLLRKNLVWGKTDKSFLDGWYCKKEWQRGGRKAKGGVGVKGGWREGVWYRIKRVHEEWCEAAPEVSQGARGTWKSCQQEEACVSTQGLSFPFCGTNESHQAAATYWAQSQALFLSFSPHPELPFFGATAQTTSQIPLESGNLGTTHPIPFLWSRLCFNDLGCFLTIPRECGWDHALGHSGGHGKWAWEIFWLMLCFAIREPVVEELPRTYCCPCREEIPKLHSDIYWYPQSSLLVSGLWISSEKG